MIKRVLVPLIIMLASVSSYADEAVRFSKKTDLTFSSLSLESGLSNGTVYTVGQDSRGAMWFGTDDKLNMYDGLSFTHFEYDAKNINSISSNSASNIFVDRDDNIWIGTWGAGLDKFDYAQQQFTHYKHDPNDLSSLSDNRIQTIFEDSSETIWVGTYAGGLNKLNEISGEFIRYINDPEDPSSISNNRIWGISEVDDGNLVIATSDGLNYFHVKNGTFESYKHNPERSNTIASSETRVVHKGETGEIWVGTTNGISRFDTKSRTFENYQPGLSTYGMRFSVVNALLLDEKGSLWVGGYEGLLQFDTKKREYINHYRHSENDFSSLVMDHITVLYQDRSGLIWVGTRGGGVSTFNPDITFSYLENNRGDVGIQPLMLDESESLWIANNDGLFRYAPSIGETRFIFSGNPNTLSEDSKGNIWAGFENGLVYRFEHSSYTGKEVSIPFVDGKTFVNKMFADGDDLWISIYRGGLYLMDMKSEVLERVCVHDKNDPSSISGNEIESIFKDSNDRLWFGTENGVSLLNRNTQTFTSYYTNFVYSIHEDMNGIVWLGSRDGLHSIKLDSASDLKNNTVKIKRYDQTDGLPNNMVYGVQEDDRGNIWVSTEYGISKFDKLHSRFINYNRKNGLKFDKFSPEFTAKSSSGEIYFGGIYRTVSFFPENIMENTTVPSIIITKIEVNGKPLKFDRPIDKIDAINLTYKDILFSFEFSALDFISSRSNQYSYMLEGFDTEWIHGKNRTYASYTNINPGEYTFRVKASNSDGYWNEEGVAIKIVIAPPWWDSMTVKVTGLITITISLMIGYFVRTNNLKRLNTILEKNVSERTRELAAVNEELSKLASIDALTQLANRRYADLYLETEWNRSKRNQNKLSIIMLDIDCFKEYNDIYGHPQGDACLKAFACLLSSVVRRSSDIACRFGGEEFMLILGNTSLEGAVVIAETIQRELRALEIPHEKSRVSQFVTCCMGVAEVIPQNELSIADLIQSADDALYIAKKQGRNQIVVGDEISSSRV